MANAFERIVAAVRRDTGGVSVLEKPMRVSLAIAEKMYGLTHPKVAEILCNLGVAAAEDDNRLDEAEQLMRRALAIDLATPGHNYPEGVVRMNHLSKLLRTRNRLEEAEQLMRQALAIDEVACGPDHPDVARDLNNLAQLLKASKRLYEAEPMMRRGLAIDEAKYGAVHLNVGRDLYNLAALLHAAKRDSEAEPLMRRAVAILETVPSAPNLQEARANLKRLQALLAGANKNKKSKHAANGPR